MLPARGVNSSFRPTLDSPSRFLHYARPSFRALVAQLDRALGFEPRCRGFESSRARHSRFVFCVIFGRYFTTISY